MSFLGSITGSSGAKAAKNAGITVTRGEEENQKTIQALRTRTMDALEPFTESERVANDRLLSILRGNSSIQEDPLFAKTLDQAVDAVDRNFTAGRKSFSGQRATALRDTSINAQNNFFDRLRSIAQPNVTASKVNADVGLTQQFNAHNTAAHAGLASGQIGAANARAAGASNLIKIATLAAAPFTGGSSLAVGGTETPATTGINFNPSTGLPRTDIHSRLRIGGI